MPFLENVTRGRNVPRERLEEVARALRSASAASARSTRQNRDLIAALETELRAHGIDLPIYFGNRNWHPFLADTLREHGSRRRRAARSRSSPSAFSSYSGCRQYREDIHARAGGGRRRRARGADSCAPSTTTPASSRRTPTASAPRSRGSPRSGARAAHVVFTAHSIPSRWPSAAATTSSSPRRCAPGRRGRRAPSARASSTRAAAARPHVPWLEPDVCDHLRGLAAEGVDGRRRSRRSASSPTTSRCSTTSTSRRAARRASSASNSSAPPTVGTHPAFVVDDPRADRGAARPGAAASVGRYGPSHDVCAPNCCLPGTGRPSPWERSETSVV